MAKLPEFFGKHDKDEAKEKQQAFELFLYLDAAGPSGQITIKEFKEANDEVVVADHMKGKSVFLRIKVLQREYHSEEFAEDRPTYLWLAVFPSREQNVFYESPNFTGITKQTPGYFFAAPPNYSPEEIQSRHNPESFLVHQAIDALARRTPSGFVYKAVQVDIVRAGQIEKKTAGKLTELMMRKLRPLLEGV